MNRLSAPVSTDHMKITVQDVRAGADSPDCAISEVTVCGN